MVVRLLNGLDFYNYPAILTSIYEVAFEGKASSLKGPKCLWALVSQLIKS